MRRLYENGYQLKDNEYLLKIRLNTGYKNTDESIPTGFITKFNQDGTMPVAFKAWDANRWSPEKPEIPIYIHTEDFKDGWRLHSWRFGQSQNWATVIHPDGFTLEVYLTDLLNVIKESILINGSIMGKFKWEKYRLLREIKK